MIDYQVVGRGRMKLYNFTGTCIYDLKEAIRDKEILPNAADLLKLLVGKPGKEKQDLDEIEASTGDEDFDFTTLCSEYEIKERNPICVVLPGKRLRFLFLMMHIC